MDSGPSGNGRGLLRLKYLNKAIIGTLEGTLEQIKWFVSSKVSVCCTQALNYHKEAVIFFFFREQIFRGWKATHENHENFPPRNFSAIRYFVHHMSVHTCTCTCTCTCENEIHSRMQWTVELQHESN